MYQNRKRKWGWVFVGSGVCIVTISFVTYGLVGNEKDVNSSPVVKYAEDDPTDTDVAEQKIRSILYSNGPENASLNVARPGEKIISKVDQDEMRSQKMAVTGEMPVPTYAKIESQPVQQANNNLHNIFLSGNAKNSTGIIVPLKEHDEKKQDTSFDAMKAASLTTLVQREQSNDVFRDVHKSVLKERQPGSSFPKQIRASKRSITGDDAGTTSRTVVALNELSRSAQEPDISGGDEKVEFDSRFLNGNAKDVDVSRYAEGNPVMPGNYNLDVLVNDQLKLNAMILYIDDGNKNISPFVTEKTLTQLGIKYSLKSQDKMKKAGEDYYNLLKVTPGIKVRFDQETQELNISIPQLYIENRPDGYIDPSLWDEGITAGTFSYDVNAYHSDNADDSSDSVYSGLHYGLNFGEWRFRSRGALNWESGNKATYDSQEAWLQRDIASLKSQLVIGQSSTRGDTFDSVAVKGIHLYNDDRMLTGAESGYAPTIKGVANTNAKVTVKQNGNIIKQVTVPPGPFEITDITPSGFGNDLDVTVTEADGREQHFSVPFSSVSQLLREDSLRWEVALGQLDQDGLYHSPDIATASVYYGLTDKLTTYAGFQSTDQDYEAFLLGSAVNTALGAFAFDATQSYATLPDIGKWNGTSYRLSYSQQLAQSKTSVNVAAWRYATEHYLSLSDATNIYDQLKHTQNQAQWVISDYQRLKDQLQVNITQPLDFYNEYWGSLYVSGSWNRYWSEQSNTQYSLGYSNAFRWGTYSITAQRSYDENNDSDDSVYLSFNLPFEKLSPNFKKKYGFTDVNMGLRSDSDGTTQLDASTNGNSTDNRFNYSLNTSYSADSNQSGNNLTQVGGNVNYASRFGPWNASLSGSDRGDKQMSLGASGGMILYHGGLVFVPDNIDSANTIALVSAPGAEGSHVGSSDNQIDHSGYGVVTNLSPYHRNMVNVDISQLDNSVYLDNTSATVIPDAGAVVEVSFKTKVGTPYVFDIMTEQHSHIPFGADVYDENNEWLSAVGQGGKVLLRGMKDTGTLHIKWGEDTSQQCYVNYHLPARNDKKNTSMLLSAMLCKQNN
ncbi:TPA: outer membrane usher protein [Salmonella enterica subsp. enterica serovar Panama]|uniref:Outer membrane usher protein n=1 Tax=Salmonella enterica TaxID=28901 RepID=A0A5V3YMB1_SALER|nr:outer membrane usher protein [Salmonella enterica]EAW2451296.1 outer membrane usher protein [Salmonella enterica subsp. diarizonae]EBE3717838.1 outer membrane usher protein [Salmonella enterica subsp. diarizonae serovar 42:l,v:1,5,7]EBW1590395.1 outer membrane usher protein [Salmonella enterica subsp. diarizonae serovar 61:r:z]ECH9560395.1 outer membrane usher protein [Salmonella enterica subsp. salamae]EDX3147547.1 outer membrane usher protein [Salmonella enterica subsp. diarizonae serovar